MTVSTTSATTALPLYNVTSQTNASNHSGCQSHRPSPAFSSFHHTLIWLLFAAIVIGNSIVLTAVGLSKKKRHSRMTFFIFNLALADLLVGLFSVLYENMLKSLGSIWYGGLFLCALASYLSDVVTYSSSYVLVALSIDRLHAIARPMSFTRSSLRGKILIGIAWLLAFSFSIPQLIYRTVRFDKRANGNLCLINFPDESYFRPYFSLVVVAAVIVPAVVIAVCYTTIIYIIWTKSKITTGHDVHPKSSYTANSMRNERLRRDCTEKEQNGNIGTDCSSRGVIPKAKIRTIKMTLVIVLAFIFCWSPFSIYNLLQVYQALPCFAHRFAVTQMIQSLATLNSAVNPLIYGIFSTRICQHLRRVPVFDWTARKLCCCCCPKSTQHGATSGIGHTEYSNVPDTEVHAKHSTRKGSRDLVSRSSLCDDIQLTPLKTRQEKT